MKALVIGHEGFVGRHLCPLLRENGYEVVGTENFEQWWNFEQWRELSASFEVYDVVVHLGAHIVNVDDRMKMGMKAYQDISLDYEVCTWVEQHPPTKCFLVMSSCAVDYPDDPYCIIKRTLEGFSHTLHKKGVPVVTLRPFSGYGPDQSPEYPFRAIFDRAMRREDPLTVWGGSQVRDWLWIDDLCSAILAGIEKFPRGQIYDIGTCVGTSLKVLARMIAQGVNYSPEIKCDRDKESSSPCRIAQAQCLPPKDLWEPKVSLQEGIYKTAKYLMRGY